MTEEQGMNSLSPLIRDKKWQGSFPTHFKGSFLSSWRKRIVKRMKPAMKQQPRFPRNEHFLTTLKRARGNGL